MQNSFWENISYSLNKIGNKTEVNISELKQGIYFLKIKSGEKEIIKKFVK